MSDHLERIANLLAQAEGTDNEAEAAAFAEKAQKLATLHSIELAAARAHAQDRGKATTPTNQTVTIGQPGMKGKACFINLAIEIASANDLKVAIAHNNTYVNLWGFKEDIDATLQLYGSLLPQMVAASEEYLKRGEYKNEVVYRKVTRVDSGYRYSDWDFAPVPKTTARTNFQNAYALRIGERLSEAAKSAEREVEEKEDAPSSGNPGTAVVLAAKRKVVADYYDRNANARGSWRDPSSSYYSESAVDAGHSAANSARLRGSTPIGGARKALV